ncbi:MAG TPA: hypothetical protein HA258_00660 [Thermoplasmata archaeon]|jgi:hypothetical protein|nr:hypothetical protein [Thermoplasmata archaeon]
MKKNLNSILKAAVVIAVALAMIVPASAMNSNTNTLSATKYTNESTSMSRGVVFQDSFETYEDFIVDDFPPWTTFDGDGGSTWGMEGYDWPNAYYVGSFMIFNPTTTTPPLGSGYDAHTGIKYASCWDTETSMAPNDDWLFTPLLSADTFDQVILWGRSLNSQYGLEDFEIGVSTTDTNPTSFTILQINENAPITWTEYTVDISAYTGQSIYIGIHVYSFDVFAFFMDDFQVTGTGGAVDNTPPITTCTLAGTQEGGVYTSDVTVTLNAVDGQSGVNYTMYKLDSADYNIYTGPFVVAADGTHTVLFYSVDNAGNIENEKTSSFTIEHPIAVTITISGGLGVSATIKNTGATDLTNIAWSIALDGKLIFVGKAKSGTIASLAPGESVAVKDFVVGFGKTNIAVTAGTEEASAAGTVLLILVIGVA